MTSHERKIRVLMTKPNMDGHWRGAYVVTQALRDAGMEIIYVGYSNTKATVELAIQEDVDVIGLSLHSCDNVAIVSDVMRLMKEKGIEDRLVVVGGVFTSKEEIMKIKELGAAEVFPPGSPLDDIVDFIQSNPLISQS